jgi:hypothetical protein
MELYTGVVLKFNMLWKVIKTAEFAMLEASLFRYRWEPRKEQITGGGIEFHNESFIMFLILITDWHQDEQIEDYNMGLWKL